MNDSDKPETPATPEAPPPQTDAAAPPPAAPPPAAAGKPDKRKPNQGGGPGGMPNRRTREAVPALHDHRLTGSQMKDLDAEIEGELEAALGGVDAKSLLGAE